MSVIAKALGLSLLLVYLQDLEASLEEAEEDIDILETRLDKVVKLCNHMIEVGKTFNTANINFTRGVQELVMYFKQDDVVSQSLGRFTHDMTEIQKYQSILLDQAHRSICKTLHNFIRNDIRKIKEAKKHFDKLSDDMDNALVKHAQAPKSKPQEYEDAHNTLTAMKSAFSHTSLDYVFQMNILHSKKRFDVLDTMLAYMHAQNAYFHQGNDLFNDLEPYMKQLANQVEELSAKAAVDRKEMEERHTLVQQKEVVESSDEEASSENESEAADIKMEGYLFKRTSGKFKSWVRRYFMIHEDQLVYRKRSKDNLTIMEEDLRLCLVKPHVELDRRFCFEVVSPTRSHMLQADSAEECSAWITAIQTGVSQAFRDRSRSLPTKELERVNTNGPSNTEATTVSSKSPTQSTSTSSSGENNPSTTAPHPVTAKQTRMKQLLSIPGNNQCCDCGSTEPRWASINLGITLCIECSGIHRSFGVHMSKVRSVTLDSWEPELLKVMAELGNTIINRIYEADVPESSTITRATSHCNRNVREAWIRAKYVDKSFMRKLPKINIQNNGEDQIKKWSVVKRKRRSPSRQLSPEDAVAEGTKNNTQMVQGESQDSGLGGSTSDVILFGAGLDTSAEMADNVLVDSDESSTSETEDADTKSTTSLEDFTKLHPDMLLYKAAQARNLPVMREALAQGADPNWSNEDDDKKNPLMEATLTGSIAACEFLLLNGAKVDKTDKKGRTALHHATIMGHTGQVCQFLKRGANQHAVDEEGKDPLTIAVESANADIVTLLRLAKLNEEMRETEGVFGNPGDETFNDVFRDFATMASENPEKLNRNK
ncbi:unnamed protein product [Owenia fusiformis]|uniref:Uncharacterized protein n=1 Tax=Owenia fusiformis TaxID=6347 RepID=A0A8S4MY03_OWEFU|nr:unnamed protein product [Owenia fusiformis]